MIFFKVIGKYLELLGILDIWVESEVFGEIIVENIFKGKFWNWVVWVYKLSYEVFWRVLWFILILWVKDNGKDDVLVDFLMWLVLYFDKNFGMDIVVYSSFIEEVG